MTTALLDIRMLIALLDPSHTFHIVAARWFIDHGDEGWATCPLTQNGFVRIVSHPSYPKPVAANDAVQILLRACNHPAHAFWPDDVTLTDDRLFDYGHLLSSGQVTDAYLLGLAVKHDGHFITLDQRINVAAVREASPSHLHIPKPQ